MGGYLLVRGVFVALVVYVATIIGPVEGAPGLSAALGAAVALVVVLVETRLRDAAVTSLLGGLIGFGLGLLIASKIGTSLFWADTDSRSMQFLHAFIIIVLPYLGLVMGARKGEWLEPARFVSLVRDARPQTRQVVLDTSVIIDGRVADIVDAGFLSGTLVVPQFVLSELQTVADSSDPVKRHRGQRGLDILNRMQKTAGVDVTVPDTDFPEIRDVDQKLIELAQALGGPIVTNDLSLNKVAQLRGVAVLNINDLANALKPVVLPGEQLDVFISKEGKEPNQGVGYLDDGTMVVVEGARSRVDQNLTIVVTSVLQTTAGRMIFGRPADTLSAAGSSRPERRDAGHGPRPVASA